MRIPWLRRTVPVLLVVAAFASSVVAPTHAAAAGASTVRLEHKPTGLTLTAPRGYTLRHRNGYYTVRGGGAFGVFMNGTSPLTVAQTGAALVTSSRGKLVGRPTRTATSYRATIAVGRRAYVLTIRKVGANVSIALIGPGAPPVLRSGRLVQLSATQLRQVAVLESIIRSRRGGAANLVNIPIPMRLAQTADFLASANVPNLPGWQVDGGNGLFTVTHPQFGWGWFGMTVAALTPEFPFARPGIDVIINPSGDPGAVMTQAFPQYMQQAVGHQFAFTNVQILPGSEGILGPTIPSAVYQVTGTWLGRPFQGLFLWGITNQTQGLVNSYFSGVLITDAAPGSLSNALLRSWASANGEAGFRERLSISAALAAIPGPNELPGSNIIVTPSRFRTDASTWISLLASGAR